MFAKLAAASSTLRSSSSSGGGNNNNNNNNNKGRKTGGGGSVPWVEKYRPREISDIAHQEEVVETLRRAVSSGNLPHLLFYGPAGSGKTSAVLALANELFGSHKDAKRVLELNASDERGIDVVRNKIKKFAQTAVVQDQSSALKQMGPLPNFKLIILDEADSMTDAAQTALRRTIEDYSHITRFCLICNYVSRIIDPIASRCAKFRFRPLPSSAVVPRLLAVARAEAVALSEDVAAAVARISGGDLRKAIMYLQSASALYSEALTPDHITEISGFAPPQVIEELGAIIRRQQFEALQACVEGILLEGYPATQILSQLFDHLLLAEPSLSSPQLARLAQNLAVADARLTDGADESLQLLNCCSAMQQLLSKPIIATSSFSQPSQ